MDEFLRRCGGGRSVTTRSSGPRADWGACLLLFTAKHETSPLALSLANQYRCQAGVPLFDLLHARCKHRPPDMLQLRHSSWLGCSRT